MSEEADGWYKVPLSIKDPVATDAVIRVCVIKEDVIPVINLPSPTNWFAVIVALELISFEAVITPVKVCVSLEASPNVVFPVDVILLLAIMSLLNVILVVLKLAIFTSLPSIITVSEANCNPVLESPKRLINPDTNISFAVISPLALILPEAVILPLIFAGPFNNKLPVFSPLNIKTESSKSV